MSIAASARIHPSAVISEDAQIGESVVIGPHVVIEGSVTLGANCVVRPHAHLIGNLICGEGNSIGTGTILGEAPQHLSDRGEDTWVVIGNRNIFREHVTVHRGSHATGLTKIGDRNYFMVNAHVGHDCRIGNDCILVNGSLLGGHCLIQDRVLVSGNSAVHQHTRLGRLSMLSGVSCATKDIPPFITVYNRDQIIGVNVVGMKRAGISTHDIQNVRKVFHQLYRQNLILQQAVAETDRRYGDIPIVQEILQFIRESKRGCSGGQFRTSGEEAEAA